MSVQDNEEVNVLWGQCVAHLLENKEIKGRKRGSIRLAQPQGLYGNTLIIAVPTEMARKTFQEDLSKQFKEALHSVFGPGVTEAFVIDEDLTIDHDAVSPAPRAAAEPAPAQPSSTAAPERAEASEESPLPPLEELEAEARHAAEPASFSAVAGSPEQPTSLSVPDRSEVVDFPSPQHSPSSGAAHHIPEKASTENQAPAWDSSARLNDKYVFDTFVIGQSNRFAHAAALAVAENPASAYNPLFIYGDSGLGKTHLLHAIGHYATKFYPGHRVRYVNSEEFTNDFINSIRDDEGTRFKQIYRNVDLLLIDDIQFLAGKEHTQEEFFHTFNTLHNHEKQVVITSDLPPKQLTGFADRLRSRFEWGLITDVQPPELETRIAILRKKAKAENLDAPDEVMEYIATHISTNIRELEGALIRVTAFASLNGQPVDLALTETIMKDLITDEDVVEITPAVILGQTADFFDVTIEDLKSKSRNRTLVTARQIAMYLLRELTEMSLPRIGAEFGGRDHTTVMHAERKIRQLMAERRQIFNQVTDLTNRIKQQQRQQ